MKQQSDKTRELSPYMMFDFFWADFMLQILYKKKHNFNLLS